MASIFQDIGMGNRVAYLTAKQLLPDGLAEQEKENKALVIKGTEGMIIKYAKCCHPIPGDSILGHFHVGRGVLVHVDHCQQVSEERRKKDKIIELVWNDQVEGEFTVPIRVGIKHERGLIATLATKINSLDTNIESINVLDLDAFHSRVDISINVRDRVHLARIMRHIKNIKSVTRVNRVKTSNH
jgi:guanosine-3',5'-bis(diphosphate) 3'-pyrophosphohydrolase